MQQKNARSARLIAAAGVFGVVVVAAVFFGRQRDDLQVQQAPEGARHSREELVEVGGVRRPITDIRPRQRKSPASRADELQMLDYGKTPPVARDANPQVASVAQALETGQHPERLSALISPEPFDNERYLANPRAYLNTVEPGRVWQVAQPGPDVPRLKALSSRLTTIEQGQAAALRVEAIPGAPVTFTSFDLGSFENQLTSITVRADEKGIAQATFTGTPGTINNVNILAGSPMTSGQIRFIVDVKLPRRTPAAAPK